jgi:TonB-linked SusC/RagA family outer membrane protein
MSQGAKLNLSVKDKSLKEVIKMIENQSNFRFFFSDDYLDLDKKVTLTANNQGIEEVLSSLLEDGTVTFKLMEYNVVVITPASAQQIKVTGVVVDAVTGEPLPGVNVIVKGTTRGITTDIDGKFSIDVSKGETLVFSYIGYTNQDVVVGDVTDLRINLAADIKQLDEIVVVGYGVMKKRDLTGAVSKVSQEDIIANKSANVLQVMQGKVAGLDMAQTTGQAGGGLYINLRGNRSINASNNPLILVDGIEYGSTLDINPSDIESIEVLKDASSTAIYGTKGANGVIIITTKKGGQGKSHVTFNAYWGNNSVTYLPEIMNSSQYLQKRFETRIADLEDTWYNARKASYNATTGAVTWNQTLNPEPWTVFGTGNIDTLMRINNVTDPYRLITTDSVALALINQGVSLDYLDMIFINSWSKNYELGFYGGNDKTSVNLSLGLMDDRGLLRRDKLRRYNFRLGIDHQLFKNLKTGANFLVTYKKHDRRNSSIFNQALKTGTIGRLYNDDGVTYRDYPDAQFTWNQPNPMLDEVAGVYVNNIADSRFFGSTYLSWEIIKGLIIKSNLGADISGNRNGLYGGPTSMTGISNKNALTTLTNTKYWSYTWDNTVNFTKAFGLHEIQTLLGSSVTANSKEVYTLRGDGQQTGKTEFYDWNIFASASTKLTSSFIAYQMSSIFGRLNYKFNEKYLFQASIRADGASQLAEGKKWGYFPSASVGWRLNEENFLKNAEWISNLKLRFSWGISGNSAVDAYWTLTQVSATPVYYTIDDVVYSSLFPASMGNQDLRWETTNTWDAGLDFGFFNNRINGSIDVYKAKTTDLLLLQDLPPTSFYTQILKNVGSTENKGIEIFLNTQNVKFNGFEWNTDWNFAMNRDKVVSLNEGVTQTEYTGNRSIPMILKVGEPVYSIYDYEYKGIYQVSDLQAEYEYVRQQQLTGDSIERGRIPMISNNYKPGDVKLNDVNQDGQFTAQDKKLYDTSPKYTFGITNNFSFSNNDIGTFGLSVMVYSRIGHTILYDFYNAFKPGNQILENGPYVDAWTPVNTGARFPRYYTNGTNTSPSIMQTLAYMDASFVKIKDITLSYSLPKKLLEKYNISGIKFYYTGKNLFTFSKIDNYDPEVGGTQNFPLAKQHIFGLNLEF